MRCPDCGHENVADYLFCEECGRGLTKACPNCQSTNPIDHAFCLACGHAFAAVPASEEVARAAPRQESVTRAPSPPPSRPATTEARQQSQTPVPRHPQKPSLPGWLSVLVGALLMLLILFVLFATRVVRIPQPDGRANLPAVVIQAWDNLYDWQAEQAGGAASGTAGNPSASGGGASSNPPAPAAPSGSSEGGSSSESGSGNSGGSSGSGAGSAEGSAGSGTTGDADNGVTSSCYNNYVSTDYSWFISGSNLVFVANLALIGDVEETEFVGEYIYEGATAIHHMASLACTYESGQDAVTCTWRWDPSWTPWSDVYVYYRNLKWSFENKDCAVFHAENVSFETDSGSTTGGDEAQQCDPGYEWHSGKGKCVKVEEENACSPGYVSSSGYCCPKDFPNYNASTGLCDP